MERKMKKKLTLLDKLQIALALGAALSVIPALINDHYFWLLKIANLLIALYLIVFGIQRLREKGSGISYFIIGMGSLIILLSFL